MKYRHLIWDFDGTLFDTYPRICRAYQKALADAGIVEEEGVLLRSVKKSLEYTNAWVGAKYGLTDEELWAGYRRHSEEEGYETMRPYEGMESFLRDAAGQGCVHYLYTHRGVVSSTNALSHYGLLSLFKDHITGKDGFPLKPAPDALNALIARHQLDRADCVMIGDRELDVMAGVNAGIASVAMDPDGLCPKGLPAPYASSYEELRTLILQDEGEKHV